MWERTDRIRPGKAGDYLLEGWRMFIQQDAAEIRNYVRLCGWTRKAANQAVRDVSAMEPLVWAAVMALADELLA